MEGNYAFSLIKHTYYCALTSLDTGLDVAHVAYSLMYVHVAWSWPVALACAAYSRLRGAALLQGQGRGLRRGHWAHWASLTTAYHAICHPLAVYVLDVGPWP